MFLRQLWGFRAVRRRSVYVPDKAVAVASLESLLFTRVREAMRVLLPLFVDFALPFWLMCPFLGHRGVKFSNPCSLTCYLTRCAEKLKIAHYRYIKSTLYWFVSISYLDKTCQDGDTEAPGRRETPLWWCRYTMVRLLIQVCGSLGRIKEIYRFPNYSHANLFRPSSALGRSYL